MHVDKTIMIFKTNYIPFFPKCKSPFSASNFNSGKVEVEAKVEEKKNA